MSYRETRQVVINPMDTVSRSDTCLRIAMAATAFAMAVTSLGAAAALMM